ncbi:MAG: fatty acid desaturase, partial [Gammaproteobacteria bacterium]
MLQGLVSMPWWGHVLVALVFTHLTIAAVTIYLHRNQAHRAVDLHPVVSHFFRLWLWLSTGMNTREWTAVHRKHHAAVETLEDPHSPVAHGIKKVLTEGAELYRINAKRQDIIDQYGYGTPDDWVERHFYTGRDSLGIFIMMGVNILLFGPLGLTIWAVQMAWIPIFAAGVINGIGHYWGYRNFETADASTNIMPWGILIGGEELHNNHHAFGSSAKFSVKPWEFDLGWMYIRIMETFGLATVRKLAPARPAVDVAKSAIDFETLKAVAGNRLHVMADFGRMVVKRVHREELAKAGAELKPALKPLRRLLLRAEERLNEAERDRLQSTLPLSQPLAVVYGFRQRLQDIYEQRAASKENLLNLLQDWCQQA